MSEYAHMGRLRCRGDLGATELMSNNNGGPRSNRPDEGELETLAPEAVRGPGTEVRRRFGVAGTVPPKPSAEEVTV